MKAHLVVSELLNTMSVAVARGQSEDFAGLLKEAAQLCRKSDGESENEDLAKFVRKFAGKVAEGELVGADTLASFDAPVDDEPVVVEVFDEEGEPEED